MTTICGYITRRRCIGKNLAFADIQVEERDGETTTSSCFIEREGDLGQSSDQTDRDNNKSIVQVVFQRNSLAWNKERDETFPSKNSKLPYGGKVSIDLWHEDKNPLNVSQDREKEISSGAQQKNVPSFLVRQWRLLENPRDKALIEAQKSGSDGISCTLYLKSRGDAFLRFNDNTLRCKPKTQQPGKINKLLPSKNSAVKVDASAPSVKDNADTFSHGDNRAKALRANVFASWLIQTYGKEYLASSGGVLDVAGGKGKLSIELALQANIPSTIIDPLVRKHGSKLEPRDARRIKKASAPHPILVAKPFNTTSFVEECKQLLNQSALCVGLHPDECTEDILDVALRYNKPVAIVPCCVFSGFFPLRTLPSGKPVRTYEDFLEYLLNKDGRLQKETLKFQGRNVVIYLPPNKGASRKLSY